MNHDSLVGQMRAALAMLRGAMDACPKDLWNRKSDSNRFWVIAYHTLYFTHLYLFPSRDAFVPWKREVSGKAGFDRTHLGDWEELTADDVYAQFDLLAYCDHIDSVIDHFVASTPFDAPSGFPSHPFTRGEAHLSNLRHIQHHTGQLSERLRQAAQLNTPWVFTVPQ